MKRPICHQKNELKQFFGQKCVTEILLKFKTKILKSEHIPITKMLNSIIQQRVYYIFS